MKYKFSFLALLIGCFSFSTQAQNWGGGVDASKLNWGFMFQYVSTQNQIRLVDSFELKNYPDQSVPNYVLKAVEPVASPGFAVGGLLSYRVHKLMDLRFSPSFTLTQRRLNYYWGPVQSSSPIIPPSEQLVLKKETPANLIELPVAIKIKSERIKNYRFYMLGGLKYSLSVNSDRKLDNSLLPDMEKYVNYKGNFMSFDAGAGMDFYLNYFKMSAELKYAKSFGSVLKRESGVVFSDVLDKVYLRHISLSLIFETTL